VIPAPDTGFVYPKTGLDVDLRFEDRPHFTSSGSCFFSSTYLEADGIQITSAGDWSVAGWFRASTAATGTYQYLLDITKAASQRVILYLASNGDFAHWGTGDSSPTEFGDATVIQDGTWHHVCFTVASGTDAKVYVDGQLNGSATVTSQDLSASSGTADIGGTGSSSYLFDDGSGNLAHLGIWNAELSQSEIRELMMATTYAEAVSKSGNTPAHYWLLESDLTASVGGINADASSGGAVIVGDRARLPNGYDLTGNQLNAVPFSGRAWVGDGSADYCEAPGSTDTIMTGGTFSTSFWAKTSSNTEQTVMAMIGTYGWQVAAVFQTDPAQWKFQILDDGGWETIYVKDDDANTPGKLDDGQWRFIVATCDSGAMRFYLNGVMDADTDTANTGVSYPDIATVLHIGSNKVDGDKFNGSLADLKIWNIALSQAQVDELFANREQILPTGASSTNLKAWYPLNDYDVSGADSLDGLYMADASQYNNPAKCISGIMEFSQPGIPQMGLRSSSSRLLFDGTNDYVNLGDPAESQMGSGDFSFAFWCQFGGTGEYYVVSKQDGSPGNYVGYRFGFNAGKTRSSLKDDDETGTGDINGNATVNDGAWHHYVYTIDRDGNCVGYIDGSADKTTDISSLSAAIDPDEDLIFGASYSGGSQLFLGIISEVAMYKGTILDADAITVMYNSGIQGFDLLSDSGNYDNSGDVDGWWKLDNPVTIQDLTANDNDGTVAGTPNMVTVPEGTTEGLSVVGSPTSTVVGSSKINLPVQIDSATQFSGYLKHPCPTWGTGEWCVAFWFRTNYLNGTTPYFWDIRGTANTYGMRIYASGTSALTWKPKGADSGEVAIYPAPASGTITDGAWHFVALQRLGATSQKWHFRRITDASFNTGTNSTGFGDMTDAGTAVINGSSSATSPSGGQLAMPRIYIGQSFSDDQVGSMFEQGKRFLIGDS